MREEMKMEATGMKDMDTDGTVLGFVGAVHVVVSGRTVTLEAAAALMDDELRERLHGERSWRSEQDFVNAYCAAHWEKFGEDFVVN